MSAAGDRSVDDLPDDGLNTDAIPAHGVERIIRVTADDAVTAHVVADRFWQLGVRGVAEADVDGGRIEVSSSVGGDVESIRRAVATFEPSWNWTVDAVPRTASEAWKEHAEPVEYRPGMWVIPAWHRSGTAERVNDPPIGRARRSHDEIVTRIDPGSAFGLGDHPTTKGCLALLSDVLLTVGRRAASVLDVGCGTGVLSVLAAQLGVPTVRAIDVAHAAVTATRRNAELNGVAGRVDVDTTPLAQIDTVFDVVVANILAPVLVRLAGDLARVVAADGTLVVGGVLAARHDHVLAALEPFRPVDSSTDAGWTTLTLRRPTR